MHVVVPKPLRTFGRHALAEFGIDGKDAMPLRSIRAHGAIGT
ncbi:hypothetical protein MES4922_490006 [Mesorhizobium ventifaucium]|uniref:Uncharacterized protein n=1 Tax=Mesorhizobium ventifaucium TaxID=666020 RepID=A0ABN8K9K4_9HYPH|nr:hypothetical protein MES4922_490006 [Mesorhizobium ventifaucium]